MSSQNQHIEINDAILMAYINGELNDRENDAVDEWLSKSDRNKQEFEDLKKAWEVSGKLKLKPVAVDTDAAWLKVMGKIEDTKVIPLPKKKTKPLNVVMAVAASLAVIFVVYLSWNKPINEIELMATNEVREQVLTDGSKVTVNKNSQITYPEKFDQKERRVKLKGEAFFDVERDTTQPFIVDLPDDFFVKVLGTSFSINTSDDNSTTTVFVKSGKVEFGNAEQTLVLVANEKAIYHQDTQLFEKLEYESGSSKAEELYWMNQRLVFEGEKLTDIIDVLNTVFDQQVVLNCDKAADYPIVSDHQQEDLEAILEVICLVHDLTLTKVTENRQVQFTISCNE